MWTFVLAWAWAGPPRELNLWQVEKDGAVSHLFGTCHLPIPLAPLLPAPHDGALREARVVIDEADLDIDPNAMLPVLFDLGLPPLSTRLAPEAYRDLTVRLGGWPAPMLEHAHDWVVSVFTSIPAPPPFTPTAPGGGAAPPIVDVAVAKIAADAGRTRLHLESVDEQFAVLRSMPVDLTELAAPSAARRAVSAAVLDACWTGDLDASVAVFADPTLDPLLGARNAAWVPKLLPELAQGDAFVAVGLGHMVGEGGLLARLKAEGYKVKRLKTRAPGPTGRPPPSPLADDVAPRDLAAEQAFRAGPMGAMIGGVCDAADGPLRVCMEPDADRCTARVAHDFELCLGQYSARLREPEIGPAVFLCTVTGLSTDFVLKGPANDAPMCQALLPPKKEGR